MDKSSKSIVSTPIYLFNSSLPSSNPGSIQVANMCSAMTELSHDVNIIVPKTGLDISISEVCYQSVGQECAGGNGSI